MSADEQSKDLSAHRRGVSLRRAAEERRQGWIEACLEAALEDPHPFVRSEGATALKDAPAEDVVPLMAQILESDVPAVQRWRAERMLIRRDPEKALPVLRAELESGEKQRARRAVEALGRLGPRALPHIERAVQHEDPAIRRRAAKSLATLDDPTSVPLLLSLLDDGDAGVRLASLRALARMFERPGSSLGVDGLLRPISKLLGEGEKEEQLLALKIVARSRGGLDPSSFDVRQLLRLAEESPSVLIPALELVVRAGQREIIEELQSSDDPRIVLGAVSALAGVGAEPRGFASFLSHEDPRIRCMAVRGIAVWTEDPWAARELARAADDADEGVRWLAHRATSGKLDRQRAHGHRGREPSAGASATWPFGLPPPQSGGPSTEALPLAVGTVNLSYNLNLGVLIRAAEAAGASEVLVAGRDFYHRVAAMGTDRYLDIRFLDSTEALVEHARAKGYQLVAVQQSPGAERFDRANYPPRPCLLLGSEGPGLPPELCARADMVVEIPQRGQIDSLNVACAATLVLWACLAARGWI